MVEKVAGSYAHTETLSHCIFWAILQPPIHVDIKDLSILRAWQCFTGANADLWAKTIVNRVYFGKKHT